MAKTIYPIFKRLHRGQGGFTLIELLIVIVILGVIGAVVALNVGGFFGTGTLQAANTEADTVMTGVFAYMADNGVAHVSGDIPGNLDDAVSGYLVGAVKATYTIETGSDCGITAATPPADWTDIEWSTAVCKWVKKAA